MKSGPVLKFILIFTVIFIVLGVLFVIEIQGAGELRLIFCDVGQGDGILIVTPENKQIVIDGGPGTKIIDCLSDKMPFWDRTIEMMILTHAQKDHMEGQIEIFERYGVRKVGWNGVENETEVFKEWKESLEKEGSEVFITSDDDIIRYKGLYIDILWPRQSKLKEWQISPPNDLNETSVVARIKYNPEPGSLYSQRGFCAYLTGDLPKEILEQIIDKNCQILKISHHGSKTGTNKEILDSANPEVAVIQVGRNSFGHPHQEVMDLLEAERVKILRNDKNGIIEIKTDGKRISTRS